MLSFFKEIKTISDVLLHCIYCFNGCMECFSFDKNKLKSIENRLKALDKRMENEIKRHQMSGRKAEWIRNKKKK